MQIQNDYNSFSHAGRENPHPNHTHHITKCMFEEEQTQEKAAAAGIKSDTMTLTGTKEKTEGDPAYYPHSSEKKDTLGLKKGLGVLKDIWDSMGDEKKEGEESFLSASRAQSGSVGVEAASSAIHQGLPQRIVNKWESLREKIKTGFGAALKRFGKDRENFGALSDPKGYFSGKRNSKGDFSEKTGKGTRTKKTDILTAIAADSHLMDSYTKTGEYCQLNEHLSNRKTGVGPSQRPSSKQ